MRPRILTTLLLIAAGSLACSAPERPGAVLLIVIDTLRADHLGAYGYASAHTPHLDALAARGVRFTDSFSSVPVTLPSVCSILTGRYPFEHGVRDNQNFVLDTAELTLAEQFRDAGYRTGAVVASAVLSRDRGVAQGFAQYDDAFSGTYPFYRAELQSGARGLGSNERRADVVTQLAQKMIEGFGDDPYFLMVHYFDPHTQHDPPPEFRELHPDRLYDGEISFVDAEIGRLLESLDRTDALIVVVADHGEGLGEHGEETHGFLLYQSTLHVPWIVAGPGVTPGLVREDAVALVDVAPTLARACGLPATEAPIQGRALSWNTPDPSPPVHYAECFRTLVTYGWSELRALRRGPWKIIQGPDSYEAYDLARDPHEGNDLAATTTPEAAALAAELERWVRDDDPEGVLRFAQGMPDLERIEALEALGYVGNATPTPPRPERPHPKDALPPWSRRQYHKAMLRAGMSFVERGEIETGLDRLTQVLDAEPDNVTALYYRGLALESVGRNEEGWSDLMRAESLDPAFAPLQLELASREGKANEWEKSWRRLEGLLAIEPENTDALTTLAESCLRQGNWQRALGPLRALVLARPDDPRARLHLARSAHQLGLRSEAETHYQILLDEFPEFARENRVERLLKDLY